MNDIAIGLFLIGALFLLLDGPLIIASLREPPHLDDWHDECVKARKDQNR